MHNKNTIRLTESDLKRVISESVQRILSEHSHHQFHDWHNHHDWDEDWHNNHLTHMSDEEYGEFLTQKKQDELQKQQKLWDKYSKRLANPKYNIYSDGKSEPIRKMDDSEIFANFKRSSRYLKNMEFVAYGKEKFNARKNTTWHYNPEGSWTKPWGGVWASPVNAQYGWAEYLNNGNLGSRKIRDLSKHFRFKLSKSAKIYMIDNAQDLIAVSTKLGKYDDFSITAYWYIDFHKLCNDYGCDGVFITDNAARNLRRNIWLDDNGTNVVMSLWEWDVCSIWIANLDIIEPLNEDAFERARFPKKGLDIDDSPMSQYIDVDPGDRYWLQMQSDYEKYGNQNIRRNMGDLFNGQHPAILAQGHGNRKDTKLARKFDGTIQSGLK